MAAFTEVMPASMEKKKNVFILPITIAELRDERKGAIDSEQTSSNVLASLLVESAATGVSQGCDM